MNDKTQDDRPDPERESQGPVDGARDETVGRWKLATVQALEEIRRLVRRSGLSQRQVEERAGFSKGYLSQLLARNLDLKMWHVLAILDALELNPGVFFLRVYPATRFRALESFQRASKPLSHELDEVMVRLYSYGVESLDEFRQRLGRCEQKLEEMGPGGRRRAEEP